MTAATGQCENGRMLFPSRAVVNLTAIRHNIDNLRSRTQAQVMAVVKADAYGHGLGPVMRTAYDTGVRWFGIAQAGEALAAVDQVARDAKILTWLYSPGMDLQPMVATGIHLSVSSPRQAQQVAQAARQVGKPAHVHLKIDTGMARGGARPEEWPALVEAVLDCPHLIPEAVWSHLARADEPTAATTAQQLDTFLAADQRASELGLPKHLRHLAASAGLMFHPDAHLDLVRPGIALYGLPPDDSDPRDHGLVPAMRLEADLIHTKHVPDGTPVSYGHTATVPDTRLGVVPLGYADGIPRQASNQLQVAINGQLRPNVGRVCMDQFVVDLGADSPAVDGDTAVIFGPTAPLARDLARQADTIAYTVVTQLGPRVPRSYVRVEVDEWK